MANIEIEIEKDYRNGLVQAQNQLCDEKKWFDTEIENLKTRFRDFNSDSWWPNSNYLNLQDFKERHKEKLSWVLNDIYRYQNRWRITKFFWRLFGWDQVIKAKQEWLILNTYEEKENEFGVLFSGKSSEKEFMDARNSIAPRFFNQLTSWPSRFQKHWKSLLDILHGIFYYKLRLEKYSEQDRANTSQQSDENIYTNQPKQGTFKPQTPKRQILRPENSLDNTECIRLCYLFGLDPKTATPDTIKSAYRQQGLLKFHPDKFEQKLQEIPKISIEKCTPEDLENIKEAYKKTFIAFQDEIQPMIERLKTLPQKEPCCDLEDLESLRRAENFRNIDLFMVYKDLDMTSGAISLKQSLKQIVENHLEELRQKSTERLNASTNRLLEEMERSTERLNASTNRLLEETDKLKASTNQLREEREKLRASANRQFDELKADIPDRQAVLELARQREKAVGTAESKDMNLSGESSEIQNLSKSARDDSQQGEELGSSLKSSVEEGHEPISIAPTV